MFNDTNESKASAQDIINAEYIIESLFSDGELQDCMLKIPAKQNASSRITALIGYHKKETIERFPRMTEERRNLTSKKQVITPGLGKRTIKETRSMYEITSLKIPVIRKLKGPKRAWKKFETTVVGILTVEKAIAE